MVLIKGGSGEEQEIRDAIKQMLSKAGAVSVSHEDEDPTAPLNLVMEIPGTGDLAKLPGIALNAHIDTLSYSTPELMTFDPLTSDFYHLDESDPTKRSSFGGDDRSGVAVIVETIRFLNSKYWNLGTDHRRIVLIFTADEERGLIGATHLSKNKPDLFKDLEISLSIDGPLDLRSNYPEDSFIAVVSPEDATLLPYQYVLELMGSYCKLINAQFAHTEYGLGSGDFAAFPPSANAGLHLRSPVRGWHSQERVNVQDQINHTDLLCYLLLAWDKNLPADIAAGPK